ncbi:M1 family metallopeptidase [Geodermatophilaceae bacterium NBWT11]|nr:M1 family metallopeptidase [Geodermatophilaceae bacterium NBWT11]
MTGRGRLTAAALGGVLVLTGCTSFAERVADVADTPAATATEPPTGAAACPDERAAPDPDRPQVALSFDLSEDRRTVTGTETVVFTPDLDVDELVFRLVPNAPGSAEAGSSLVVDDVTGDDVAAGSYESLGAAGPGGAYVVELSDELAAGDATEVTLAFTLTLGEGGFDRVGTDDEVSWWASGAPLLAWEPGVGWSRAPFVDLLGETASSPVADTRITVEAPAELTVLMTGDQAEPTGAGDGRRRWTSREPVARDVSVAVGSFTTASAEVDGVRVTAGVLAGDRQDPQEVADATAQDVERLAERFGPFPYATLTVPVLPDYGGGIEYPSSILLASAAPVVLLHEVAHMWFYGMVGDDQYRDPWLDEAFASYAESVEGALSPAHVEQALAEEAPVGGTMADFPTDAAYVETVYGKGAAALAEARDAAGAEAFDTAVRCYVDATAWTTATPADLALALADLPAATRVLVEAGALDEDDLPD